MKDIKDLKAEYAALKTSEQIKMGESLVKVNLGYGMPDDFKRVASFLKGSLYIAKEATLDPVIEALHGSEENKLGSQQETQILVTNELKLSNTDIKNISSFDEDSEVTHKEKI